ncbi:MAG: ATP-binding protein, partial [Candidatus Methanomethylophilaceae archaeon]
LFRSDSDTERLYNKRSALQAELESEERRWGVLSLERYISDTACNDIYDNMQPRVIQTADRYLEMMTKGLYRMDGNPRTKNVSIRNGTEVKSKDQWSSGLAGQVCLSLKLAVAKELSDEKLPILLDDVLLVFDSERKLGACRALSEVAKETQIIFFTCDRETYGFMKQVGAKTAEMSP